MYAYGYVATILVQWMKISVMKTFKWIQIEISKPKAIETGIILSIVAFQKRRSFMSFGKRQKFKFILYRFCKLVRNLSDVTKSEIKNYSSQLVYQWDYTCFCSLDQTSTIQMPVQMYQGVKHEKIPEDHFRQKVIRISRSALNRFIDSQPRIRNY